MIAADITIKIPLSLLQNHMESFETLLLQFLAEKGVHEVHELRVLYRRLRAVVWVLEHGFDISVNSNIKKALRKGTKVLGPVREIDILIRDGNELGFDVAKLKEKRKSEVVRACKAVLKTLNPIMYGIEDILPPREGFALRFKPALRDHLEKELHLWPGMVPTQKKRLHQLRIRIKKMVYRLEALGLEVSELREFQRAAGKLHDLEVLKKYFGKKKKIHPLEVEQFRHAERIYNDVLEWRAQTANGTGDGERQSRGLRAQ